MTHSNDRETYNREVRREVYTAPDSTRPREVINTTETVGNIPSPPTTPYRNGQAVRVVEQRRYEDHQVARDNDNAARGLLVGILLTSLAGLVVGSVFLLNRRPETPAPAQIPVAVPNRATASPSPQSPRVIERTQIVPVPQQPAPNVNITVPNSGSQQAPATSGTTQTAPNTTGNTSTGTTGANTTGGTTSGTTAPGNATGGTGTGAGAGGAADTAPTGGYVGGDNTGGGSTGGNTGAGQ